MPEILGPVPFNDRTVPPASGDALIGWAQGPTSVDAVLPVVANTGAAYAINPRQAVYHDLTVNSALSVLSLLVGNPGQRVFLTVRQDATGGRFVRWPANISWEGNARPTLPLAANSVVTFDVWTLDGLTWFGRSNQPIAGQDPLSIQNVTRLWVPNSLGSAPGATVTNHPDTLGAVNLVATSTPTYSSIAGTAPRNPALPARLSFDIPALGFDMQAAALAFPAGGWTLSFCAERVTAAGSNFIFTIQNALPFALGWADATTGYYAQAGGGFMNWTTGPNTGAGTGMHVYTVICANTAAIPRVWIDGVEIVKASGSDWIPGGALTGVAWGLGGSGGDAALRLGPVVFGAAAVEAVTDRVLIEQYISALAGR